MKIYTNVNMYCLQEINKHIQACTHREYDQIMLVCKKLKAQNIEMFIFDLMQENLC